jgi:hypothetical protein
VLTFLDVQILEVVVKRCSNKIKDQQKKSMSKPRTPQTNFTEINLIGHKSWFG